MPITKENVQEADQQAQEVVNTCTLTRQSIAQGKSGVSLRDDFEALFKLGLQYRSARTLADNRRECNIHGYYELFFPSGSAKRSIRLQHESKI